MGDSVSYHPKHFALNEVIPAHIIAERGERAWALMDDRILMGADWLRGIFGPAVINGKYGGKVFTESGLRDPLTTTGAKWSQHKFGRALDLKFTRATAKEVYDYILANQPEARANGITCVEDIAFTPTWLHIDCRKLPETFPANGILIVRP
jgi:hypothetical protein